jgi:hypothetical protein
MPRVISSPEDATRIALSHLVNPEWEPAVTRVEDAGSAWRVFYNSRVFVETRESSHALAGNLPLLIDKATGDVALDLAWLPIGHPKRPDVPPPWEPADE